jgi:CBS domain-containing protein
VVDDGPAGRRPLGILTDRDIVTAVVARRIDAGRVTVGDVMVTTLHTARSSDSMMDLMRLMRAKGVRRLPVLGPEGELVGLVTLDDVLDVLAQQLALLASTIEAGRDRERRQRR